MANSNTVERKTVEVKDFGSLDRQAPACGVPQAWVLRDLRPMADGSLLRREGYVPMLSLGGEVRGVCFTERGGSLEGYAVAGGTVYALRRGADAYEAVAIGGLGTQTGDVRFMRHDGSVILMDGSAAYSLTMNGMDTLRAYVPLYGKDWSSVRSAPRPVNERPNLLTRQLRFRYIYTGGELFMDGFSVESVDGVTVNGKVWPTWRHNTFSQSVIVEGACPPDGSLVDVYVTMTPDFFGVREDSPWDAGELAMVGDAEQPRAVLFGGTLPVGKAWIGREIASAERVSVRVMYPDACMAYVTEEDTVTLGDGTQPITGACSHLGRSLIFTADQTWMADGSTGTSGMLRFIPVNTTMGCTRAGAVAVLGNSPYTLHRGRVLRWTSRTDERDECNAEVVSSALGVTFAPVGARLLADPVRRELWCYARGEEGALVMREDGAWTVFRGFAPDGMFTVGDAVGFYTGDTLYRFDADAVCDVLVTGERRPIEAEYQGRYMDFGQAGRIKRLCHATVVAECGDQEIELGVQDVRGRESRFRLRGTDDEISVLTTRAHSGRFRYLRIRLRACGEGRLRLCGLAVTAR